MTDNGLEYAPTPTNEEHTDIIHCLGNYTIPCYNGNGRTMQRPSASWTDLDNAIRLSAAGLREWYRDNVSAAFLRTDNTACQAMLHRYRVLLDACVSLREDVVQGYRVVDRTGNQLSAEQCLRKCYEYATQSIVLYVLRMEMLFFPTIHAIGARLHFNNQ